MKSIFIFAVIAIFSICDLSAQCQKQPPPPTRFAKPKNEYSNWPRKDQLDYDISRAKPGTKRYALLVQERERVALDEIHKAQKYLLEYGKKKQKKRDQHMRTLQEELRFLAPTLAQIPDFPFAKNLEDILPVLTGIRDGKIEFENLRGRSYTKILAKIHDMQKKQLNAYQKRYMKEKF